MKIYPAELMTPEKRRLALAKLREAKKIMKQERDLAALASNEATVQLEWQPELMMASKKLAGNFILTAQDIIESSRPFKKICGVYFIISGSQIIYVGQSVDVLSRIGGHENHWEFDAYSFVECTQEKLDLIESIYIHLFNPPLNGDGPDGNKFAPVSIKKIIMMAGSK